MKTVLNKKNLSRFIKMNPRRRKNAIKKFILPNQKFRILLLTNRDSDNVGDQVIEACDISLIEAVMKNLGIRGYQYIIDSEAAAIIPKEYVKTKNPELLEKAHKLIETADVVVFGGAPMFNYDHQIFYERTSITLEIAEALNKPVIFSGIGIEGYDETNEKCLRLKKALNLNCVKQITTRDDFTSLEKFIYNENIKIMKVADPAVFTKPIFSRFLERPAKRKIGVFVMRRAGFTDNKINFSAEEQAALWKSTVELLEKKGYDYELITNGHFSDEAFMDYMIREHNIPLENCVFNMNTPEFLVNKISSYDAVISCRLHPSIISYALKVPSIGITWNQKVPLFYESIGYSNRALERKDFEADKIILRLEEAMEEGVKQDGEYLMTVYNTLFYGIKNAIPPLEKKSAKPYNFAMLQRKIPLYPGSDEEEKARKLTRKARRTYDNYNELIEKIDTIQKN